MRKAAAATSRSASLPCSVGPSQTVCIVALLRNFTVTSQPRDVYLGPHFIR